MDSNRFQLFFELFIIHSQVSLMMVGEMMFFLYWEFIDDRAYEAWGMVINEISNLLFYDMLILPYLILNRFGDSALSCYFEFSMT